MPASASAPRSWASATRERTAPSRSSGSVRTRRCSWRLGAPRGGHHLAFALSPEEFEAAFARVREAGLPFGDSFHDVGNMQGPGEETGARGPGPTVYLFDPNGHLVELRHY